MSSPSGALPAPLPGRAAACLPGWSAGADRHDPVSRRPDAADDGGQGGDGSRAVTAPVVHDHDGAGVQGRQHPLGDHRGARPQIVRRVDVPAEFGEALADARRLGSLPHVLGLSCYRALHQLRIGNLAAAEADARVALETGPRPPGIHAAVALAALLQTLAERGELEAAEAADQRYRFAEQFPTTMQAGWLLAARGRLRLAELRPAAALGDLLAAGDLFTRLRVLTPSGASWRSDAALAHLALGAPAEARALAAEEVTLARAFRGPGTLGIALRAAGLAEGGSRGIELLRQAVGVLEDSGARLEHARAVADLGAALRRAGHRAESREILRLALASPTAAARSPSQSGPAPNWSLSAGDPGGSSSAGSTR
jgi:hypothetical protein